ncbi:MAG: lytic transglycosylase domain-containing protein [Vicinamibacterales bacterium]
MRPKLRICLAVAAFLSLVTAGSAHAEIVLLTSGSTLAVKSHRLDGDTVTMQMRSGGEVTCHKSLIAKIVADEVPYEEPQEAAAQSSGAPAPDTAPAGPYGEIIASLAQAHGVDPVLVNALIKVESNYRPGARSHKGAMGLMQLMPATARRYNVRNAYDPKANVAAGVQHLKALIDRWGRVELALAAYNAGEGAVRRFNGIPPYRETRNYVRRILSLAGITP